MITRQLVHSPPLTRTPAVDTGVDPYQVDSYFTDGVSLFRIAGWLSRPSVPPLVELEDCRSLQCTLLERDVLLGLCLRPVVRAGS
jgi:hypothetical protein